MIAYSATYTYIRTFLGDYDPSDPDYADTWIDSAITWVLALDAISGYSKVAGSSNITPDITANAIKLKEFVFKVARCLLLPKETFDYRTDVLQVQLLAPTAKQELLDKIEDGLEIIGGGGATPIASDGSINQYGSYGTRVKERVDEFED